MKFKYAVIRVNWLEWGNFENWNVEKVAKWNCISKWWWISVWKWCWLGNELWWEEWCCGGCLSGLGWGRG